MEEMEKRKKIKKLLKKKYNLSIDYNEEELLDLLVEKGIVIRHLVKSYYYYDEYDTNYIGNTLSDDNYDIITRIMSDYTDEIANQEEYRYKANPFYLSQTNYSAVTIWEHYKIFDYDKYELCVFAY